MKHFARISLLFLLISGISVSAQKYRCFIQMTNYSGEGAYIVASVVDAKGNYRKTLAVLGPEKKWYKNLKEWNKAQKVKPEQLSAITGASVSGGDRAVKTFDIPDSWLNKGYRLRFETAVEDREYHAIDAEIPLATEGISTKTEGKGYIRYVKLSRIQ